MPRKKNPTPSYLLHTQTGQARIRIDGREFLLPGEFGSVKSRVAYGQMIARHASGLSLDPMAKSKQEAESDDPGPSVGEVLQAFKIHADGHYVKNGKPTSEIHCFRACMRIVRELYGMLPAKDFGPMALKAVRQAMVNGDPDAKNAEGKPAPRTP